MIAVGGWFTEVLSAAVGPKGKVYRAEPDVLHDAPGFAEAEKARDDRLGNVSRVHGDLPEARSNGKARRGDHGAEPARHLQQLGGEAAAVAFCKGVYDALKPGGVFGVIDHVGIAGQDNKQFHRIQIQQTRATSSRRPASRSKPNRTSCRTPRTITRRCVRDPSRRAATRISS